MGFELIVAARRDPLDAPHGGAAVDGSVSTQMLLNGVLDEPASQEVLRTLDELFDRGDESVIVEMQNVDVTASNGLVPLGEGLMARRASGKHVQVCVRDESLHARMATMRNARDWLIAFTQDDVTGARRAIHVDGPSSHNG